MAQMYVRSITRCTMYQKALLLAGAGVWKNSSVARGLSSTKIDYSDLLEKFNQQNINFI